MQPDEPDRLARPVPEELVIKSRIQRVEAGDPWPAAWLQIFPALADAEPQIGRDAFRHIPIDADLPRAVRISRRARDGRQAELIGDKRVVGQDRGRKETGAGKAVRVCLAGKRDDDQRAQGRASGKTQNAHFALSRIGDRVITPTVGPVSRRPRAIGRSSDQASCGGPRARLAPVRLAGRKSPAVVAISKIASTKTMRAAVSICGRANPALACQRQHSE